MSTIFISHSSADNLWVDRLTQRLRMIGYNSLFVAFDPEVGIPAGYNWERELYSQLYKCDAVVFVASLASVASQWCFAEIALARSLGRPVLPIRVESGAALPLLRDVQWIDFTNLTLGFDRLLAGMRQRGLDPRFSFRWDNRRPPYPGLTHFQSEDAAVFCGREVEVERLARLFLEPTWRYRGQFVAIVGPSGSGKSSLLRAGLIPRLTGQAGQWLLLPPLLPGNRPIRNFAICLAQTFEAFGREYSVDQLHQQLGSGSVHFPELARELVELASTRGGRPNLLIVIDQAEELITRSGPLEKDIFLRLLRSALDVDGSTWAVATVRSEYISGAPERAGLAEALDESLIIEPLSRRRLSDVIQGPARRAGLRFEPGLSERMIEDTAGGDALPMLAYTLHNLYLRAGREGLLTHAAYEQMGGVAGAIQQRADRVVEDLNRHGLGAMTMPTLTKLVTIGTNGEPTARRISRDELTTQEQLIIDAFVDASLLVVDRRQVDSKEQVSVSVAHESLIRQWSPLRSAVEEDRAGIRLSSDLEKFAADWDEGNRDESYLLRGGRLANILYWSEERTRHLTPLQREFLDASQRLASRDLKRARRVNARLRRLTAALSVLLVAATVAAGAAWQQTQRAHSATRLAWSEQVAVKAEQLVADRPDVAILAGLESLSLSHEVRPDPPAALVAALAQETHSSRILTSSESSGHLFAVAFGRSGGILACGSNDGSVRMWDTATGQPHGPPLIGHEKWVSGVEFSPDGNLLASASGDETVRLWDTATGKPHGPPLTGHTGWVSDVAFSPDGRLLASVSYDRTVQLWDTATGKPHGPPLTGHTDAIRAVAFSPDGQLLASASDDRTMQLWDTATGQPRGRPLTGHTDAVSGVAFSPDGRLLASASYDRTVRLWDAATRQPHGPPLAGHTDWVSGVAFSADGRILASAGFDRTVRLWDTETGLLQGPPLAGHTNTVRGIAFSPDGRIIASAGDDQTVRLWDTTETITVSRPLEGHTDAVTGVAFSPDAQLLATGGNDGTVRLWDATLGQPHGPPLTGHTNSVSGVAFSPDGRLLASASNDRTVRLWDTATGQPHGPPLTGHSEWVSGVVFSPDGRFLAAASYDGTARLWDTAQPAPASRPLTGHTGAVRGLAFSPDSRLLATASDDRTVRLWDTATGQPHGSALIGHTNSVSGVAFSPNGQLLASASYDRTVRLWDTATGQLHGSALIGHTNSVSGVAFSPNGQLLASASYDRTVRLWDTTTGQLHGSALIGHTNSVSGVAFSPNGQLLASASYDRTVRLWNLGFSTWQVSGCALVNRNLSIDEWRSIMPEELPYERTCPDLPSGEGAPADAPPAVYAD